jgi:hypothetical protein
MFARSRCWSMILITCCAASARADVDGDALRALERGVELFKANKLPEARAAFERARRLAPSKPNPYRWLGLTDARLGDCAHAVAELADFIARVPGDDPRTIEAVTIRDRCLQDLAPKVGTLIVESDPPGAEVRVDDEHSAPVGVTPYKSAALPAGAHGLFVSLAGHEPQFRSFTVGAGGTVRLEVLLPATRPVPVVEAKPTVEEAPPVARSPLQLPERRPLKLAAIGLLAGALAVAATGAALMVDVVLEFPTWQQGRTAAQPDGDLDLRGRLQSSANAGLGLLIGGGALLVVDAVIWGLAARPAAHEPSVQIAPTLNGFIVRGSF